MEVTALRHKTTKTLRFNYKIIEWTLPSHQQGSIIITVDYNSEGCKMQTLSKEEYMGQPRVKTEDKNKGNGRICSLSHLYLSPKLNTA